jgi:DNA-binding HxlR family transcriptional regulator
MVTMDATTRREQDKIAYNAMLAACPTRQLLDVLSDKWVCLVLTALTPGPRRHSELSREIAGVSQKMLTQTLVGLNATAWSPAPLPRPSRSGSTTSSPRSDTTWHR